MFNTMFILCIHCRYHTHVHNYCIIHPVTHACIPVLCPIKPAVKFYYTVSQLSSLCPDRRPGANEAYHIELAP